MRLVTSQWADAIGTSHRVVVRASIGDTELEVLDGAVTLDITAATRGRCDISVIDQNLELVPSLPTDLLAPYGNEVRIERGLEYPDGSTEIISLGVFRIEEVEVQESTDGVAIRLVGLDRSARVIDARFEEPYQIAAGTNAATAILDTIQAGYPEVQSNLTATSLTLPAIGAIEGDDRWAFCQGIATAIGMDLYFDGDGILVSRPIVLSTDALTTIAEGEGGVLVEASARWSRQDSFNRVIVTGEDQSTAIQVRGVATDDNPLSPTYYYGPYGRVPYYYSSPEITTNGQAADVAATILARQLGATQSVSFGAIVDPALEPRDVVRITRERIGIDEDHIIDQLTIPLNPEVAMSGTTRATQVT